MLHTDKHYWAARSEKPRPVREYRPSGLHRGVDLLAVMRASKGPRGGFGPFRPERPLTRYRAEYRGNRL
jgi:hypothetical protein